MAVELSFDGRFDLGPDAAEILIRLRGGDVLWQKERLLNIAWQHVPPACGKIAWLDSDVFFTSDDWIDETAALLDEYPLVVPFARVAELSRDIALDATPALSECDVGYSLVHRWSAGEALPEALHSNVRMARTHTGLAWAARREIVEELGLYDACVVGSGNRAILCAAIGRSEDAIRYLCMGPSWADHYGTWAKRFHARVDGRIGSLSTTVFHLWHGDLEHRRYAERHRELSRYGFDPVHDLALSEAGPWLWSSDKPEMHAFVQRYFAERREDG